ncbi:MAG: tyrosine-protein phosphatase [Corallococcus sp.]|nr:tyrosine-protein phosphatase [Corallococcus sp.]MCM1359897.1 tyrosine-protein phosphatase [Corallococcus sp.]MCM1395331.1 tyrosine-protein phosphatase [Corallococcus sp.]
MKIELQGASNARDLGGIATPFGTIKQGKLLRSGELGGLTETDKKKLSTIPLSRIVDLRTDAEINNCKDADMQNVAYVKVPIIRATTFGITFEKASGQEIVEKMDAGIARMKNRGETYLQHMESLYRNFVNDEYSRTGYGNFLKLLAQKPTSGATLWHCTVGKDRCGTCTALILHCLGASRDQILEDYLLTNVQMKESRETVLKRAGAIAPEEYMPILTKMLSASESYIAAFWKEIDVNYGGTDGFLQACGVTEENILLLRKNYLN